MNIITLFIKNTKTTILEQTGGSGFDDPAADIRPAAVFGIVSGDQKPDAAIPQWLASLGLGMVRAIIRHRI